MTTTQPQAQPKAQPGPTPENTPVPGGGRWHWDADALAWVEVIEPTAAAPITATEPTPE